MRLLRAMFSARMIAKVYSMVMEIHGMCRETLSAVHEIRSILKKTKEHIMSKLDDLQQQVSANTDVEASAVTLIQGLSDQLKEAGTDPAKLQALQDQLAASASALAAAITANTPAAPPAPPA